MVERSDVYISFDRRDDTVRYSFVSHLSAAFHRRGISSFVGGSDPEINGLSRLSKVAMENSKASVVVFSEKYLSSSACLEDLVMVSERRRNNGLAVVPVFYTVTQPSMKKQIWKLGHDKSEWRSSLLETVDLPGHVSSCDNKQSDSEFVEEIVADVREKLNITKNIGIYSKLLTIENLLRKQLWGVRSIGLWGMPGIGKTTLAKAIFDQISVDYEASCFIKDFNKEFHAKGLYSLLEEHFGKTLTEELGNNRSITRPILLRNVLRHKRVLVILDDVHKPLDAELFLGGFDWFSSGSLIIITSRDKQVFSLCRIDQIYEVPGLNKEESLKLFSRYEDINNETLQKLSMKVIDYANGNPLALTSFGQHLRKNLEETETRFVKLKKYTTPHEIHDAVKITYDSLSSNEKNIFLDIACLFNGENVDYVMHFLAGCGYFPRVEINVLVEKCLVSISQGKVIMHNLIQCIGRKIINGEKRRSRLWKPSRIKHFIEDKRVLGSEDIEAISLDSSILSFDINPMTFENMFNLRYLKIYSSNYGNNLTPSLSNGLKSLPYELRLLHWENFPLLSLPQDFDTKNLVILNMCYSQLEKLWKGTKELEMLKRINLCHSKKLVDIEELQNARNVEVIDLQGCIRLEKFLDTSYFKHLRVINLSGCIKIKTFPKIPPNIEELYLKQTEIRSVPVMDCVKHLKILDLSHCLELEDLKGIPKNLRKLYLGGTNIQELSSLTHLSELIVLDLQNCQHIQELPIGMSNLNSLEVLNLSGCSELEDINGIPRNLEELYLAGTAIQEVSSSIKNLSKLVTLDFQDCKRLEHLPMEVISNLKSLTTLNLSDSLREVPKLIISGPNHLLLTYNENADRPQEYLPRARLSFPRFYAVVSLSLVKASLKHIPEEICYLHLVTMLDLGHNGFTIIPESIKQLSKLQNLRLRHCRNLISLPELPQSLKLLNLHGCVSLQSVSWAPEQFPSHYTFNNCFDGSPKVARKRMVKGLAKVASIGKEHQQELIKALAFSICVPEDANQTTSYNLRTGSFATIKLTSSLRKTLLGFAIFIVVTFSDDSHNKAGLGVRCISKWKTSNQGVFGKVEKVFRCWAPREAPEVQRDHMFVFYEDVEMHPNSAQGDKSDISVEFEFKTVNGRNKVLRSNCMVTECDVCVITGGTDASLSVISASKDMSLSKKQSPNLSGLLSKLRFKRIERFVGCVCL